MFAFKTSSFLKKLLSKKIAFFALTLLQSNWHGVGKIEVMKRNLPLKLSTMKKLFFALPLVVILMVACNSKPQTSSEDVARKVADSLRLAADTAGLAQFQAWRAQNEMTNPNQYGQSQQLVAATPAARTSTSTRRSSSSRSSSSGGTMSSSSSNTAKATQKKGWSKAAKGAVIGGVAGAAGGAIINKRNRVVGGVVGGVLGAGVGYGIGRHMDKKDGRY